MGAAAAPAAPATPAVQWRLLTAAGEQFGPLSPEELATWVREGRVAADSQVYCDGWTSWKWASDAFPQLQAGGAAASQPNPYDFAGGGALAPDAAPRGGARKSPGAATGGAGWHDVKTGLQISMASLIVGAGGLLLLMIAILGLSSGPQDVSAAKLMANMMIWGGVSLIGSFFSMLTGFLVCWGIPRRSPSRGMAVSAAVSLCVSVALLVVVAPGMLTLMGGRASVGEMQGLATAMKWLILVTNSAAMIMHAFFAAGVAREFGDRGCGSLAIGFTVLEAASFLWFVYLELGGAPKSENALKMMMVLTFLLAIASRVYLAVIAQRGRSRVVRGLRSV